MSAFIIKGSIEDVLFGEIDHLHSLTIELWRPVEDHYEYLTKFETNKKSTFSHGFEFPETSLNFILRVIRDGQQYTYSITSTQLSVTDVQEVTVSPGITELDLTIDFEFRDIFSEEDTPSVVNRVGQLFYTGTETPLTGRQVQLEILDQGSTLTELGEFTTNSEGMFPFPIINSKVYAGKFYFYPSHLSFKVILLDDEGSEEASTTKALTSFGEGNVFPFEITATQPDAHPSKDIGDLITELSLTVEPELAGLLSSNNIATLYDIRYNGGLKNMSAFTAVISNANLSLLDSHAQMELISDDYALNQYIISDKGYSGFAAVAAKSRSEFINDTEAYGTDKEYQLGKFYHAAHTADKVLRNSIAAYITSPKTPHYDITNAELTNPFTAELNCSCDECTSAVSPLAYLSDLIEYAVDKVSWTGSSSDPETKRSQLQDLFNLKFLSLTKSCAQSKETVCQYRIAVEMLYQEVETLMPLDSCESGKYNDGVNRYLTQAYKLLLEAMGTTYNELKKANSGTTADKEKLANKLGIVSTDGSGSTIEQMFTDIKLLADPSFLEEVFGLKDYTKEFDETQPTPLVETWKKQFLEDAWAEADGVNDPYNNKDLPIIDPDLIGPDDFRDHNASGGTAYDLWLTRRQYLDNTVYNNTLYVEAVGTTITAGTTTISPKGVQLGNRKITVSGGIGTGALIGSKALIDNNSADNDGLYTVTDCDSSSITVAETISSDETGGTIGVYKRFEIVAVTDNGGSTNDTISILGDLSTELSGGDTIKIINSTSNDGEYTIAASGVNFSSPNTVITLVSDALNTSDDNLGAILYHKELTISDMDLDGMGVVLTGDHSSLTSGDVITITDAGINNGEYEVKPGITISYDDEPDTTFIEVDGTNNKLLSDTEEGIVSYERTIAIDSTDFGDRTIEIAGSRSPMINVAESIKIIGGATANNSEYSLSSTWTQYGNTYIKVDEAIPDNRVAGSVEVLLEFSFSTNALTFSNIDLSGEIKAGDTISICDTSGPTHTYTEYEVLSVSYSTNTVVTLTTSPSIDDSFERLSLSFLITDLLLDGNSITLNSVNLENQLFIGNTITVSSTGNSSDGTYTVKSISISGGNTEVFIDEVIPESMNTGSLTFTRSCPINKQHPLFGSTNNVFDELEGADIYGTSTSEKVWDLTSNGSVNEGTFIQLARNYKNGVNMDTIEGWVSSLLNLTMDAFLRMVEIYEKHTIYKSKVYADQVTSEEWTEFFDILVSAANRASFTNYLAEENSNSIVLSYEHFWTSVEEPKAGSWPPSFNAFSPLVDPDTYNTEQLLEPHIKSYTSTIYNARLQELDALKDELKALYISSGFLAMFDYVLGYPSIGDPAVVSLDRIYTQLNSIDPAKVEKAEYDVTVRLGISLEDFGILMSLKKKVDTTGAVLTDAEQDTTVAILIDLYKQRVLNALWVAAESDPISTSNPPISIDLRNTTNTQWENYWKSVKAQLTKWRASISQRAVWKNALVNNHRIPVLDPDIVPVQNLVALSGTFYDEIYVARIDAIAAYKSGLSSDLNTMIVSGLELSDISEFTELGDMEAVGIDISKYLEQLNLEYAPYRRLLELYGTYQSTSLSSSEVNEAKDILTQVWKITQYAAWNAKEITDGYYISPTLFKVIEEPYGGNTALESTGIIKWRGTYSNKRKWERTVEARTELKDSVDDMVATMVREAENETLWIIRDTLIELLRDVDESFSSAVARLSDRYLTDFAVSCCQETTRVSHAIDVLQKLVWTLHTGIDDNLPADWVLDAPNYDEEWKWMGSYAYWRSAMFVFLYPENLVAPELRNEQTPVFRDIVKSVKEAGRFTPSDACYVAGKYNDYMADINNIEVQATCYANTRVGSDECSSNGEYEYRTHMFGLANNKVYWSVFDRASKYMTPWKQIDQLGADNVKILGANVITAEGLDKESIFLFTETKGFDKAPIQYLRFDLSTYSWDEELITLDAMEDREYISFFIKPDYETREQIDFAFQSPNGGVWYSNIKYNGETYPVTKIMTDAKYKDYKLLDYAYAGEDFYVFSDMPNSFKLRNGAINTGKLNLGSNLYVRVQAGKGDLSLHKIINTNLNKYIGHIKFGETVDRLAAIYEDDNGCKYFEYQSYNRMDSYRFQSLNDINIKLGYKYGLDLNDLNIDKPGISAYELLVELWNHTSTNGSQVNYTVNGVEHSPWSWMREIIAAVDDISDKDLKKDWQIALFQDEIFYLEEPIADTNGEITTKGNILFNALEQYCVDAEDVWTFNRRKGISAGSNYSGNSISHIARQFGLSDADYAIKMDSTYYACSFDLGLDKFDTSKKFSITPSGLNTIHDISEVESRLKYHGIGLIIDQNDDNDNSSVSNRHRQLYAEEAAYYLPAFIAEQLSRYGHFEDAIDWYLTLYDFRQDDDTYRTVYGKLELDSINDTAVYGRQTDWMLDPLNPHGIARTRYYSYLKYTLTSLVKCLLDYADAQFTIDTVESNSRALELYEQAIELLNHEVFSYGPPACSLGKNLAIDVYNEALCKEVGSIEDRNALVNATKGLLGKITDSGKVVTHADAATLNTTIKGGLTSGFETPGTVDIWANISATDASVQTDLGFIPNPKDLDTTLTARNEKLEKLRDTMLATDITEKQLQAVKEQVAEDWDNGVAYVLGIEKEDIGSNLDQFAWLKNTKTDEKEDDFEVTYVNGTPFDSSEEDLQLAFRVIMPNTSLDETLTTSVPFVPIGGVGYCVVANPTFDALKLRAALNLFKLRNCMNIAGMVRQVEPYAAPTDATSGMPSIGEDGNIVLPGIIRFEPTQFRYDYLIQRAKELVNVAQQMEANMLAALEKRDAEAYSIMQAKQAVASARSNVRLQDLRIKVSEGEVDLAVLQRERSELQVEQLEEMIEAGLNKYESQMIDLYYTAATLRSFIAALNTSLEVANIASRLYVSATGTNSGAVIAGTIATMITGTLRAQTQTAEAFVNAKISEDSILASQARREQEWNFQKTLAEKDIEIGDQQIKVAQDRLRVTGQEKKISELQLNQAEDTVNFLSTKFTNVELYSWMSNVIGSVYAYFLNQATATAKLALNQIAFERQQIPSPLIQDDYWTAPSTDALAIGVSAGPDRKGLTGSARLLQDIYKVDQFAFDTDQRKIKQTKTFSLMRLAPFEFQQFRETGELVFDTLMENFDRDFPGQYLRLIKRVNVAVIALVPPTEGIKATLTSSGISRTVIKGNTFETITIRREPETVAFTGSSSNNVTQLEPEDSKFLLPFEGSGVNSRWMLRLPKESNLFDYNTIADVILTVEYTALHDEVYRQQVLRNLGTEYNAERLFSFREHMPDQFYELNNPDQSDTPMQVAFDITQYDFAYGVKDLNLQHLKVYFVVNEDKRQLFDNTKLETTIGFESVSGNGPTVGTSSPNTKGLISTQSGGGGFLNLLAKDPVGKWTFALPNDPLVIRMFEDEVIEDIMIIMTTEGELVRTVNI